MKLDLTPFCMDTTLIFGKLYTMVDKIRETKNKELSEFYKKINPIIQSYMDKNNISILLDVKNIVIGRSNNNITNDIIKKINNELK